LKNTVYSRYIFRFFLWFKLYKNDLKTKFKKKKPEPKKKGKRNKTTNRTPKVMSAGPEPKREDSPFAVLEQLKDRKDAS